MKEEQQEYDLCQQCWPLNRASADLSDSPVPIAEEFICAACLRRAPRGLRSAFSDEDEPFISAGL